MPESEVHRGAVNSQGMPPTTHFGDTQISRRFFTPEEIRQRRAERQSRYRQRQRIEEADTKKRFTETAAVLKTTRAEREVLLIQHTVLSKAVDYCVSSAHAVQALVSNTVGRVKGKVQAQYHSTVNWLTLLGHQVYSPSDAQIHAFLDEKDIDELTESSEQMASWVLDLLVRYDAEPESRESIEAQLQRIRCIRFRSFTHLANTQPAVAIQLVRQGVMPTGPDGAPNPKLVEAVAALNLTPEQLESFEQQWVLYLQRTEAMRQETRSFISFLGSSGAQQNALSVCSMGAAELFLERLQAVQELELHPSKEAQAIADLVLWVPANLTTQQQLILMRHSMPYLPDVIQLGRILFGEACGSSAQAERIESLQSEMTFL